MKEKIVNFLLGLSFVVMFGDIVVYYQQPIGRVILIITVFASISLAIWSNILESEREEEA